MAGADQEIRADRHVKGCVCLSSGYDFVRENSYLHVPGNFMGPKYDSAMLHYWKGYLKLHQAQLSCSPDIDVHAGLHAKSLEVWALAPALHGLQQPQGCARSALYS